MYEAIAYIAAFILFMGVVLLQFRKPQHPRVFRFDYTYRSAGELRAGGQYIVAMDLHQAKEKAHQILNGVQACAADHKLYEDDRLVAEIPRIFD